MKKEYKDKFPEWCNDTTTKYSLCLTDDLDSLFSCILLNKIKGYEIEWFYRFDSLGSIQGANKKAIGVDADLVKGKCWGNHVTLLSSKDTVNKSCANINNIDNISRENYYYKYCGSTLLTIMSYYNIDISTLSEEAKMVLLAIDSTYLGYYADWKTFKDRNKYYLVEVMNYEELYKVQQRHTKEEFDLLQDKYKLKSKIETIKGRLQTGIDLEGLSELFNLPFVLPKDTFNLRLQLNNKSKALGKYDYSITKEKLPKENEKLFSMAVTNKGFIKYSTQTIIN